MKKSHTNQKQRNFKTQQELKNQFGLSVCVINQAVPGYTFQNQYAALQNLDKDIKPKIMDWAILIRPACCDNLQDLVIVVQTCRKVFGAHPLR